MGQSIPDPRKTLTVDGCSLLEGRTVTTYSVAWRAETEEIARSHLLQHYSAGHIQEDIALATWFPASGANRYTAVIDEVLLPTRDERVLQGNVRMTGDFLRRCRRRALSKGAGMAVMHNHLTPGWQGMSADDVVMEKRSVSNPARATGLPALGMTLGTDGTWSARFWNRTQSTYERQCVPLSVSYLHNTSISRRVQTKSCFATQHMSPHDFGGHWRRGGWQVSSG